MKSENKARVKALTLTLTYSKMFGVNDVMNEIKLMIRAHLVATAYENCTRRAFSIKAKLVQ